MKKLTLAFVIMAMVAVNQASAEMVDIGTGQMGRSEFTALKAMVEGMDIFRLDHLASLQP